MNETPWGYIFFLIDVDIGRVLAKCLIFDEFSSGFKRVLMHPNLHGQKY